LVHKNINKPDYLWSFPAIIRANNQISPIFSKKSKKNSALHFFPAVLLPPLHSTQVQPVSCALKISRIEESRIEFSDWLDRDVPEQGKQHH